MQVTGAAAFVPALAAIALAASAAGGTGGGTGASGQGGPAARHRATLLPGDAPLAHEARHVGGEYGRIQRGQGALLRVAPRFGRLKCHFRCCSVT